ncbi:FAD:protein FMN transferase [Ferrimonas balearica]|uniref:FAD:protein FMN transferase n=1 Tax=Ferrimonas balearica TaxID=44012 RepID=UPI001C98E936|nr:FAD:protein FMN transferase [Ferrimonas balearica]MBY5990605.1 FAD:protein FMN transferase [Ferrimonas balearica]
MYRTTLQWLAPLGLALLLLGCTPAQEVISIQGRTMGTTYHISWVQPAKPVEKLTLQAAIDTRLEQVNDSMSTWRPDSLISQFNRHQFTTPMRVDSDFVRVVREGVRLAELTDGALDVTVGPLVNLWGFGPDGRIESAPSAEAIREAQARVGVSHLVLDGHFLRKDRPDIYLDLSAIAKGYGVDVVAQVLEDRGIHDYLVEVGGELRLKGVKPDGQRWRIAVEQPDESGREVFKVIEPGEMAVATSGDYRNFFEEDGRRFSHLIDPRTGEPVNTRLASATVLAPSSMTADGLATAFIVMGTEASLALAERQNLPVMLIEKSEQGYQVYYSSTFKPYLLESNP